MDLKNKLLLSSLVIASAGAITKYFYSSSDQPAASSSSPSAPEEVVNHKSSEVITDIPEAVFSQEKSAHIVLASPPSRKKFLKGVKSDELELRSSSAVKEKPLALKKLLGPQIEPVERSPSTKKFERFSELSVGSLFYFSRIDGQDKANQSKASIISKLNYGINLTWQQHLTERLSLFQSLGLRKESYTNDSDTHAPLKNADINLAQFGVGANYLVGSQTSVFSSMSLSQEVYYKAISDSTPGVKLEAVAIPRFDVGVSTEIFNLEPFTMNACVKGMYYLPTDQGLYKTKATTGYQAKLEMAQRFKKMHASWGVFYQKQDMDSSILKADKKETGIELSLSWRF